MIAGGDSLDDSDILGAGSSSSVLGHIVMAPSTPSTLLPAHTFGNVRQFDFVNIGSLSRAWLCGAGPEPETAVLITIDSNISRSAS